MKICGVVAEYNPFHNGHAYHLQQTRQLLGENTAIISVMSGNYVQRGDFAMIGKYRRAAMAAQSGADLVIELPLAAALSSAEGFARGAVSLLDQLHCVTHLSFGSEAGEIDRLRLAAGLAARAALRTHLASGLSYAAAVEEAVRQVDPASAALLQEPNNTLGTAYCAALEEYGSQIEPVTIRRVGAPHDSHGLPEDGRPSASLLRARILEGDLESCQRLMPPAAFAVLSASLACGSAPAHAAACDRAIVSHLRRLSAEDLLRFSGGADGLHHRLRQAIRDNNSFAAICQAAQTRRHPLARIRRTLLRAYLNLPESADPEAHYLRILAIGPRGRSLLRMIGKTSTLPVIIKPVSEHSLPEALQPYLAQDVLGDDLFALAQPNPDLHVGGAHYRKTPFCVPTHQSIEFS